MQGAVPSSHHVHENHDRIHGRIDLTLLALKFGGHVGATVEQLGQVMTLVNKDTHGFSLSQSTQDRIMKAMGNASNPI